MKIKEKILSLLGLLSISFSAATATCPTVDVINQNPNFFIRGAIVNVAGIGPMEVIDVLGGPTTEPYRYESFRSVDILTNNLRCNYMAMYINGPFPRFPLLITLSSEGTWKKVNSQYWPSFYCTVDEKRCAVRRE